MNNLDTKNLSQWGCKYVSFSCMATFMSGDFSHSFIYKSWFSLTIPGRTWHCLRYLTIKEQPCFKCYRKDIQISIKGAVKAISFCHGDLLIACSNHAQNYNVYRLFALIQPIWCPAMNQNGCKEIVSKFEISTANYKQAGSPYENSGISHFRRRLPLKN